MGLFGRSSKEAKEAAAGGPSDTVESIIKATMVAASDEGDLPEASKLELHRLLKKIVSSGFSEESMRIALGSGHPKIRGFVADFLIKVAQSRGTLKRKSRESREGQHMMREAMESSSPTLRKHAAESLMEWAKQP